MDIEGSEYEVLAAMWMNNAIICRINRILIEFHAGYLSQLEALSVYKNLNWPTEIVDLKSDFFPRYLKMMKDKSGDCDSVLTEFDEDG